MNIKFKDHITFREEREAINELRLGLNGKYSLQQYIAVPHIEEIDGIRIEGEGKYAQVFNLLDYDYLEQLGTSYVEKRRTYNSNFPQVNSIDELPSVELTLPISGKKVRPQAPQYSEELWNKILSIKADTNIPLDLILEDILISLWLEGGIDELMDMAYEDVFYMSCFLDRIVQEFNLQWKISDEQVKQWRVLQSRFYTSEE